jgi:hypothetical protein
VKSLTRLGRWDFGPRVSVVILWEWRYCRRTDAAWVVSPGGLGEGARMKAWRRATWRSWSASMAAMSSALLRFCILRISKRCSDDDGGEQQD